MAYRPSRRLVITTAVIACLIVAFLAVLPEIVRRLAVNRLENYFTVPVAIGDIDLNLFTGHGVVESLVIGDSDAQPLLRLPAAEIEFSRTALLMGSIEFSEIVLREPNLVVERLGPSTYNIVKALDIPDASPQDDGGLGFSIRHLQIQDGEVVFIDHTQEPDYKLTLSSLNFAAGPIATSTQANGAPTTFQAGVNIGDGTVTLSGSTKDLGKPITVQLKAEINNVELQTFDVYLPYGERLSLKNSLLNGQAQYVNTADGEKTSEHYLNADLNIGGAALMTAPASRPIFEVAGVAAQNIHVDFLKNSTVVGVLIFNDPYLLIERDSDGFNFQQLMPANDTAIASNGSADRGSMSLAIERVEAENGAVRFVDEAVDPNVNSLLQDLRLTANGVQLLPQFAVADIDGQAELQGGVLNLSGSFSDKSSAGQLVLAGDKLPFHPFRGYLNQVFELANSSGERLDGKLRLRFIPANNGNGEPSLELSGTLIGRDMALRFPEQKDPLLTTERLGVKITAITFGPNPRVDIDQINFTGANLSIVRRQDGNLNLTRLWSADEQKTSEAKKDETETSDQQGEGTTVAIRVISVDKSNIRIVDRTVSPNYDTQLSGVSGKVTGIRPQAERAQLKLSGTLGDSANLTLSGWFTPFSEETDLQLEGTVQSYALPPLNPYATEYVSHRIRRGQVTMDVKYTMAEGKIRAVVDVALRNVRVGERTGDEFVNRIGIPLELAVALLEDINGVIDLQFAVTEESGLKLNIASLIWEAVRNSVVSAITAPFRLVGNILTLGGRVGQIRIDPIPFDPGTREISTQATDRVAKLAELLSNKPKLDLKIVGGVSRKEIDDLKQRRFWEMLESTEIKDYQEALIALYRRMGGISKLAAPLEPRAEESLERFVMERLEIADQDLRQLGRDRAEIVKKQLVEHGVDPERLSVAAPENIARDGEPAVEIQLFS